MSPSMSKPRADASRVGTPHAFPLDGAMNRTLFCALLACLLAACAEIPAGSAPVAAVAAPFAPAQSMRVHVSASEPATATPVVESSPPPVPSPSADTPTWSSIYARHLGPGTEGGCGRSGACHRDAMSDAPSAYEWLQQRGYIDGPRSALVSPKNSCLRWFGGNMPPRGTPDDDAAKELAAWAAAGAPKD